MRFFLFDALKEYILVAQSSFRIFFKLKKILIEIRTISVLSLFIIGKSFDLLRNNNSGEY